MRQIERWKKIEQMLKKEGHLSVQDLAVRLKVSEASIRRDLTKMEEERMITRIWGGAKLIDNDLDNSNLMTNNFDDKYLLRFSRNIEAKEKIGKAAAALIKDNDCVFIDAGSTALHMIDHITAKNILVVTNGISNLQKLAAKRTNTYVPHGDLNFGSAAIMGADTSNSLDTMNFDKVFLGTISIDAAAGCSSTNSFDAALKKTAISRSKEVFILADSSKMNTRAPFSFANLEDITIITEKKPDLEHNNLRYIIAQ
ncbi:DeoR/GlpR family DNA-binding transcription regulator [Lacrimispora sp.]|uniref:DeoR/GlpR family DNA-binding transcription regulator n=1 Tax=Lacrimispora sp. TaxID=2719234 RepID=UPI0028990181|nr:DeoR/GlpR family DNA-binding transcription regulator [Lacrimispora sp.]